MARKKCVLRCALWNSEVCRMECCVADETGRALCPCCGEPLSNRDITADRGYWGCKCGFELSVPIELGETKTK